MYKIVITCDAIGNVSIEGNIENKIIAYGLLDVARDLVKSHVEDKNPKAKASSIIQASALELPKNGES